VAGEERASGPTGHDYPEHDRAICDWFAARNWPVHQVVYDFSGETYAWRHRGRHGTTYTLHITREVLERHRASELPQLLDERDAEGALKDLAPEGRAILRYDGELLVIRYHDP
jgi:hypothetical protein